MSLVNKMLRDLDARRAGDAERGVLPTAVTPLHDDGGVPRGRLAALLVIGVLAAGGVASYFGYLPSRDASPPPPLSRAPLLAPPALPAVQAPAAPSASPVPAAPAAPAAAATPVPVLAAPTPAPVPGPSALALKLDIDLGRLPEPKKTSPPVPSTKPAARPATKPAASEKAAVTAAAAMPVAVAGEVRIDKQMTQPTPAEKAEAEFRRGQLAHRQGAGEEALARFRAALAEEVEHVGARRTLANLLIEQRRYDEAEEVLRRGMAALPSQPYWPMTLARLRIERGDTSGALDILQKQAVTGAASAEWQGFHGALLQRLGRSREAAERYEAASRLAPGEARWWAGLGIALEAAGRPGEARAAYERARSLPGLPADLAAHVEQRLR